MQRKGEWGYGKMGTIVKQHIEYHCRCCNILIGKDALIVSEMLNLKTCPNCGSQDIEENKHA